MHKKDSKSKKDHYRPISVLPNISKIYERFFFKQISEYFEQFLSKYQCGFRKGFSPQHSLLSMLEKWKSAVDNKKVFGALLMDLFQGIWLSLTNILLTLNKLIMKQRSHPEVFLKKDVLKICYKFTGEHTCQSVRVQGAGWFLINILVFTSSVF